MRHDNPSLRVRFPWSFMGVCGLLASATLGLSSSAPAAGGGGELGVWYNDSGRGAVEIRPCGTSGREAGKLCGFIVWLKNPNFKDGRPLYDGYNSDPSKRKRPICGLPVLGNLQRSSEGGYDFGWVYDPEQGQAFDAAIQLRSADRLILTGYKGVKFFSKSFVWKRAPADLPRCDGNTTSRDVKGTTVGAAAVTDKAKVAAPAAQPAAEKSKVAATTPTPTVPTATAPAATATVPAAAPVTPSQSSAAAAAPDKAKAATSTQPVATDKPKVAAAAPPAAPATTPEAAAVAPVEETTAEADIPPPLVPPRPVPAVRPRHPPIE